MSNEFPKGLYKSPGLNEIEGHLLDYRIVDDLDAQEQALSDGWSLTPSEAVPKATVDNGASDTVTVLPAPEVVVSEEPSAEVVGSAADGADVSLAEQAEALGIKVDARWGDKRLIAEIEKAKG